MSETEVLRKEVESKKEGDHDGPWGTKVTPVPLK